MHMGDTKEILRARIAHLRESLANSEITCKSGLIQEQVLDFPVYLRSRNVALYSPIAGEAATAEIRQHARGMGKNLFYPKFGAKTGLQLVRLGASEEVKPGRYGIPEPPGDYVLTKVDEEGLVVFVPGLAFDGHGNRLGRGLGWYDRVLAPLHEQARFIALAFEFQIVDRVPTDRWDQRVHYIVTERRIIDCGDLPSDTGWVS
jgi:5-formyltetrahydrofolate cyclo-ligase